MNDTLQDLMREATRLTRVGRLKEAVQAIQRALSGAAESGAPLRHMNGYADSAGFGETGAVRPEASPLVPDACVFEVDRGAPAAAAKVFARAPVRGSPTGGPAWLRPTRDDGDSEAQAGLGEFTSGSHVHASQTRRYKLYAPPGRAGRALPLVVMLHGCTQDPDDFAAGTGMNERAREQGFFVLYPEQSRDANAARCWNWFKHNHQQRDSGEPALIAGMTQAVIKRYGVDTRRVYIAGLSAGGAMAAIVAAAYPEIFAALAVHSGLPCGAASDVAGALAVMKSGVARPGLHANSNRAGTRQAGARRPQLQVPTIVFHGDQDRTVHPRNGEQVIANVLESAAGADAARALTGGSARVEQGVSPQGRRYTRSTHNSDQGNALAEHWLVHGAGHAWSGGQTRGSYTDATGPDATGEMLRFFFQHSRGASDA
jgi:poly(hydroxyalkanoate) depolymerase family esterase